MGEVVRRKGLQIFGDGRLRGVACLQIEAAEWKHHEQR